MKSEIISLAVVILVLCLGCQSKQASIVPYELVGVWRSSAPKYEECFFQLTKDLVIFANEDIIGKMAINFVSKVEKTHKNKLILYTIYYENLENQKSRLYLYYDASRGGVIRFKNQLQIEWKRSTTDYQ